MTGQVLRPAGMVMIALLLATPAQAQFGSLFRKAASPTTSQNGDSDNGGCPQGKKGSRAGRSILGGVLGNVLGDAAGKTGFGSYLPTAEVAGTLTDAIACRLEPAEQVQAAAATEVVTRGETVGATSNWTSETRPGVSGSSTVMARNDVGGGKRCMNITDVIIVDGEETRVSKQMCKGPGDSRYTIAEA